MLTLSNYKSENTLGIAGLSKQLCGEAVKMGFLQKVDIPNLECDSGSLVHVYLHPLAYRSLARIAESFTANGSDVKLKVSTCYRTLAQQFVLKQNLSGLVAPVGRSDHGSGKSIDLVNWDEFEGNLSNQGWKQSYPNNDAVHWDYSDCPDNRSNTVLVFQRLWNANNSRQISEDGSCGAGTLRALAQSPANGFINCSTPRCLSLGDIGKDVGKYQIVLRQAGLYTGLADCVFGIGMQKAVIDFQTKYGLDVSGIIGESTRGRLADYPDCEPVKSLVAV
jgi:N-acetylmuramoyl-L-alanine amidase